MTNAPVADEKLVRQQVVNNLTGSQLLSCGAGGGKTRLLVDHYLRLLQEGIEPAEIVAVTFTEAAAAELKDRLRAQCRARAQDPELAGLADWKRLAREIESAPVSTIHGFCSALLREHALALGLDPEFAVANATVTSLQLAQLSRTSLLAGLTQDRPEAAVLVSQLGLAGAADEVAAVVQQRGQLGDWLTTPRTAEEIATAWRGTVAALLPAHIAALVTGAEWVSTRQALEAYLGAPTSPKMKEACATVLTAVESAQTSRTAEALGGIVGVVRAPSRKDSDDEATDVAREAVRCFVNKSGSLGEQITGLLSLVTQEDDPEAAALTAALLREAQLARAEYDDLQRGAGALDFEDLQLQVRELWQRCPQVLARVRARVKHLLVDEFQDTSRLQWEVLGPLAGDGGAVLFVVGDPKQSIYGWRDADLTLWGEVQADLQARAPEDGYIQLAKCFRSTPHLLRFFNQLFAEEAVLGRPPADEAERLKYAAYYETDLLPERTDGALPAVELHLVSSPPAAGGEGEDEEAEEDARTGDLRFREAILLAQRVRDFVAGKQPLTVLDRDSGEPRPARYGDCALLLRAFGDVGLYEWAFAQAGVPTYVYAGGGFYGAQEIRDVVNGLRAVENQEDEVALVGALRAPLFGLSDETLFWVSEVGQGAGWWGRLRHCAGAESPLAEFVAADELAALRGAVTLLGDLRRRKNRWRLSELIRELLDRTHLAAVLASQRHGAQAVANLQKLVDIAADYETGPRANLRGFLNWLAELEVREEREGQAAIEDEKGNSLKIMTQHSAKGLEWPIVLLPDLNRQGQSDRGVVRWHPDLGCVAFRKQPGREEWPALGELIKAQREAEGVAEARRLFYVACTRARDHLLLSGCVLVKVSDKYPEGRADLKAGRPLAWLAEAFGLTAESLAEAVMAGKPELTLAGYDSQLITGRLHDQRQLQPVGHALATPPPGAAVPVDLARMTARLAPIGRDFTARRRFTATELAVYGFCPRRYELTYLQGWPTENIVPPQLNSHDRLSDTERGDVVHHLLRLVGTRGLAGLEEALKGNLGLAPEVEVRAQRQLPELRRQLEGFLESELYATVLQDAPELRTEMRVVFPLCPVGDLGNLVAVEGILDAFVATADGQCYVLDYKTGDPADTADSGMYHFQVGLYCAAVQQWRGQLPAQAWLVYLRPEQTQPLPLDPAAIAEEAEHAACARLAAIAYAEFTPPTDAPCARCPLGHPCPTGPLAVRRYGRGHAPPPERLALARRRLAPIPFATGRHTMNAATSAMWLDLAGSLWPVPVVVAVVLGALGYASARSLRALPDFPEKAGFLRGAHWFWLWVIGSVAVPFVLMVLMTIYTPLMSSGVLVCLGLTCWLHSLGERLFPGLVEGGCFFLWSNRLGSRRFDLDKWLAEREQGRARQQRYERIVRIFQACLLALYLGGAAWTFVTIDQRIFIPLWQDERLGRQLQRDLAAPEVEQVLAMQHMFQGPLYPLAIQVRPGTTPAQGQLLVEHMKQALAGRQDRHMWRIYARPEHGRKLAQEYYVPEGMQLPPNADRVHAQPRR